jgi:hypothetical protein
MAAPFASRYWPMIVVAMACATSLKRVRDNDDERKNLFQDLLWYYQQVQPKARSPDNRRKEN